MHGPSYLVSVQLKCFETTALFSVGPIASPGQPANQLDWAVTAVVTLRGRLYRIGRDKKLDPVISTMKMDRERRSRVSPSSFVFP